VYSDDNTNLRPLTVPAHLGGAVKQPPISDIADADAILPQPTFDDAPPPPPPPPPDALHTSDGAAAAALAKRVRERREELTERVRSRVNLYAAEPIVETAEQASSHEIAKHEDGAQMLATALGL
jgi:hypothetical protein